MGFGFIVYGHCASGFTEVWDVCPSLARAKATGERVLQDWPVTECGTGGVRWVEIVGDDVLLGRSQGESEWTPA